MISTQSKHSIIRNFFNPICHWMLPILILGSSSFANSMTTISSLSPDKLNELKQAIYINELTNSLQTYELEETKAKEKYKSLNQIDKLGDTDNWLQIWQIPKNDPLNSDQKLQFLKSTVREKLHSLEQFQKLPSFTVLKNMEDSIDSKIKSQAYTSVLHPRYNVFLTALDSAKYSGGSLKLERLFSLYQKQLDRVEFPDTEQVDPVVKSAFEWASSMKNIDPGLMATGNLYDAYCMEYILETYPLVPNRPFFDDFETQTMIQQASFPTKPRPIKPKIDLLQVCDNYKFKLQEKRDENLWLNWSPRVGIGQLKLNSGEVINCQAIAQNFQNYLHGDAESLKIVDQLVRILDDYKAGNLSDSQFHSKYDPLEQFYLQLIDQLDVLYPAENFLRIHSYKATWKDLTKPSKNARFVPWVVEYGPNSWNGYWESLLSQQDWYQLGPDSTSSQGIEFVAKASIHDICVDQREIEIFGFWANESCSIGDCLFLQPGLRLHAKN